MCSTDSQQDKRSFTLCSSQYKCNEKGRDHPFPRGRTILFNNSNNNNNSSQPLYSSCHSHPLRQRQLQRDGDAHRKLGQQNNNNNSNDKK
jgi:hypothetical protein